MSAIKNCIHYVEEKGRQLFNKGDRNFRGTSMKEVADKAFAELATLRSQVVGEPPADAHPERYCDRCRRRMRLNYSADSMVWNRVVRVDGTDKWSILCVDCFIELCQKQNVEPAFVCFHIPGSDYYLDIPEIKALAEQFEPLVGALEKCIKAEQDARESGEDEHRDHCPKCFKHPDLCDCKRPNKLKGKHDENAHDDAHWGFGD